MTEKDYNKIICICQSMQKDDGEYDLACHAEALKISCPICTPNQGKKK